MKKTVKKIICIVLAILVFAVPVFAAGPELPAFEIEKVSASNVGNMTENGTVFSFLTSLSSKIITLNISFPTEGGIRIFDSNATGYYEPKSLKTITYTHNSDSVLLSANGGVSCLFDYSGNTWKICALKNNSTVFTLSADSFYAEYNGSKRTATGIEFAANQGERFLGLGERFSGVKLNGKSYNLWNNDCWSNDEKSYVNVPLLHSSNGYSIFYNSFYGGIADIAKTSSSKCSLKFMGDDLDLYLYTGTTLENLQSYLELTGKSVTVPDWALGYWAGQASVYWKSADTTDSGGNTVKNYLTLLRNALTKYDEMGTMPSAIYGEGDPSRNRDSVTLAKNYGVKMLGWNHVDGLFSGSIYTVDDFKAFFSKYSFSELPILFTSSDKNLNCKGEYGDPTRCLIDYSNTKAVSFVKAKMSTYWGYNVAGTMVDYGEYVPSEAYASNGMTGDEYHNFNAVAYNKTLQESWSSRRGNDYVLFARAGSAGSQHYAAQFGGDQQSTFDGLKRAVNGGISASLCGFSVWGSDIGGLGGTPTAELYQRWLEFATFSPLMRAHGTTERNPWNFGDSGKSTFKKYYYLRQNLSSALYGAMLKSANDGTPIMQHLSIPYPQNPSLFDVNEEYMYCNDILVAPVTQSGVKSVSVVFPDDDFYNLYSGSLVSKGNETKSVSAPTDTIPAFIRGGSALKVNVNGSTLKLCDITDSSVQMLLVTPSPKIKTASVLDSNNTSTVKFTPSANGFTVKASGEMPKIIGAYSTSASKVLLDGVELPRLSKIPTESDIGYFVTNNTTYVSVGTNNWSSISFVNGSSQDLPDNTFDYSFSINNHQSDLTFLDESFDAYSFNDISVSTDYSGKYLPSNVYTCDEGCLGKGYLLPKMSMIGDNGGYKYSLLTYNKQSYKNFYAEYDYYIGNTMSGLIFGGEQGKFPYTRDNDSSNDTGGVVYIENNSSGVVNMGGCVVPSTFTHTTGTDFDVSKQSYLTNVNHVRYWYMTGNSEQGISKQSTTYTDVPSNISYYTVCVKVQNNVLKVWLKGYENIVYTISLNNYNGGYVSLFNSGNNQQGAIKGFRIKDLDSTNTACLTLEKEIIDKTHIAFSVISDRQGIVRGSIGFDPDSYTFVKAIIDEDILDLNTNCDFSVSGNSIPLNLTASKKGIIATYIFELKQALSPDFSPSLNIYSSVGKCDTTVQNALTGDINGDGFTDLLDLVSLKKYNADVNKNIVIKNSNLTRTDVIKGADNMLILIKMLLGIPTVSVE